jgi:hypothetical protein
MKGDFTRDTFDPTRHFSRVLQQQGRVQLDADGNEQTAILLHYLRTLAADLIGPYGGPPDPLGFAITPQGKGFTIGAGRYYVDGWLVENDADTAYDQQPAWPLADADRLDKILTTPGLEYIIYLDVWERHMTYLDDASLREVALGGPDTATRAQVVWQVKIAPTQPPDDLQVLQGQIKEMMTKLDKAKQAAAAANPPTPQMLMAITGLQKELARLKRRLKAAQAGACAGTVLNLPDSDARLQARVKPLDAIPDPCITPPNSVYRGAENQLYRVEIHDVTNNAAGHTTSWTFKWSRDNGSVAAAVVSVNSPELTVSPARGFAANQWVELLSEGPELRNEPGPLVKIAKVDGDVLTLDLPAGGLDLSQATKVRRWDQTALPGAPLTDGAVPGQAGRWLDLEDGLQVQFEPGSNFRSGDYWLIPARVATGQIEWPVDASGAPALLPPRGIEHHYAPLAWVAWNANSLGLKQDCRLKFTVTLTSP